MTDSADLLMPRPAGMTAQRAQKAEAYADYLYMHGAMTIDQLIGIVGSDSAETARRILRDSRYAKSFHCATMMYHNGAWRTKNKLMCWTLTSDGYRLVERYVYPGTAEWGYSSGTLSRNPRANAGRLLLVNEIVLAAARHGYHAAWMNVASWLNQKGARTGATMRKLWRERPPMLGVLKLGEHSVGVGLFTKGLQTLVMNAKRTFPKELDVFKPHFHSVLFLTNALYETYLPTMSKLRYERPDLVVLPYEYCLDHPDKLVHVLRGNRKAVFQPLLTRLANDGWIVEETGAGEPYTWKARRNGRVEYFDGTFGAPLVHLYNIVLNDTGRFGNSDSGEQVLYVINEAEAKDVVAVIKKRFRSQLKNPPVFRMMDW